MITATNTEAWRKPAVSELILSDRLIALAEDADRAGYTDTAGTSGDARVQRVRRGAQEAALILRR